MYSSRSFSGFHILELVAVMAIFGLLALVSVPGIAALSQNSLLKMQTRKVAGILQQASLRAQASLTVLEILPNAHELLITQSDDIDRVPIPDPVTIDTTETLSFYPTGANQPATLVLKQQERTCRVVIALRGRVRWSCP